MDDDKSILEKFTDTVKGIASTAADAASAALKAEEPPLRDNDLVALPLPLAGAGLVSDPMLVPPIAAPMPRRKKRTAAKRTAAKSANKAGKKAAKKTVKKAAKKSAKKSVKRAAKKTARKAAKKSADRKSGKKAKTTAKKRRGKAARRSR